MFTVVSISRVFTQRQSKHTPARQEHKDNLSPAAVYPPRPALPCPALSRNINVISHLSSLLKHKY